MKRPVRLDPEAEDEVAAAQRRYEENLPGLGDDFVDAVDAALSRIAERPKAFPLATTVPRSLSVRRAVVAGFPFSIFFLELLDETRVLAVAHQRRRPSYWTRRARRARSH